MPIVRILLVFLALASPALAEDGLLDAAAARDAAQAFRVYVEGVAKKGERPDLTRPEVAALLDRIFDLDALNALPPAQGSDLPWLLDWMEAANTANKLITRYGSKPGPGPDLPAIERNMAEYEDQFAAALNFLIRGQAREAVSSNLFLEGLAPEQRAHTRAGVCGPPPLQRRVYPERHLLGDHERRQARQRPVGGGGHPRYKRGLGELFPAAAALPHPRTARRLYQTGAGRDGASRSHRFRGGASSQRLIRRFAALRQQRLRQPQFQTGPIGVRDQHGPKVPPL